VTVVLIATVSLHDQDCTICVVQNMVANAAEQEFSDATVTFVAHHDEIIVLFIRHLRNYGSGAA